jgi:hypothetical protein
LLSGFQLTFADLSKGNRSFEFDGPSILIGRASDCDLVLSDLAVSRRHARIYIESGCYVVEDLGSSNGTKVNGSPVQRSRLQRGDALAVGSMLLEFSFRGPLQAASNFCGNLLRRRLAPGFLGRFRPSRKSWAVGGLGVMAMGVVLYAVLGGAPVDQPGGSEPLTLSATPIAQSFGYGQGVTFSHPEMVGFDLELSAPGRVLVVLHVQSKEIRPGEVLVSANGAEVGALPADVLNPDFVSHEIIVRPELLKRGSNKISFENIHAPGRQTWRIWNLWAETHLLPELPPEQLEREAWLSYRRGRETLVRQEVAPANRYLAWKDFRSAWLALEAIPDPRPSLYGLVREGLGEAQRELDQICSKLLLQIHRYTQVKDWGGAQGTLEEIRAYFPGKDHSCPSRAERIRL